MLSRPLTDVPRWIILGLLIALLLQMTWRWHQGRDQASITPLQPPPPQGVLRVLSFGDPVAAAKGLTLWLQTQEVQQGQFLSYRQLDYMALTQWLGAILDLDPKAEYPLFAASYLYSSVRDDERLRQLLNFIVNQSVVDIATRWRWLAHAAILAKHRLHDLPRALRYAQIVANHATADMPHWVQQMHVFILEDMGELERMRLEIGGLLASGRLTDPNEIRFFEERLRQLSLN
ncbi:hypothetical protein TPSD3_02230 [Thioflexithrix psekupsensis]|uniref:Uncharacterized protein n=2 Tax=Thioflexithrix psekupsensis TaxID=1570016 RepID=A0A251XAH1_9GAMM|nr:hypothetical protein TPSD3_02230 [Thioflexithrix psekupsensis]